MSTDVVPYRRGPLAVGGWRAAAEVRDARRPARVAVAQVEAGAVVGLVALNRVEMLTAAEVAAARRQGAVIDERARQIVDGFAAGAAQRVYMVTAGIGG